MSFAALGVAAGCKREPEYYKFMYSMPRGITLVCKHEDGNLLESGTEIREGYRVNFTIVQDKYCYGTPVVRLNGAILQPENGVYSFIMEKTSAIVVDPSSIVYTPQCTLEFSKGVDERIWYEYGGQEVGGGFKTTLPVGEEVEFTLKTSVYYSSDFEVYANTEEVKRKAGTQDTYSFVLSGDTVVSAYGLTFGEDFYSKLQEPYFAARDELDLTYEKAVEENPAVEEDYRAYVAAETRYNDFRAAYEGAISEEVKAEKLAAMNAQRAVMDTIAAKAGMGDIIRKREDFILKRGALERAGKSRENPFLITSAVDLYAMASYINNSYNAGMGFQTAYYKLTADVNLWGEQLFIIGDGINDAAVFCGEFDGGKHTIKNFVLRDYVIDQEEFVNLYLPYIGMFGFVSAAVSGGAPQIYDLHLQDYSIDVDAGRHVSDSGYSSLYVGGLAGAARGAAFRNCSARGNVRVSGNNSVFCAVGGLVGYTEAISSGSERYPSTFAACETGGVIECANRVWAAGGVLGYAITPDPLVTVSVVNSRSEGKVSGAVNTGGIVGHLNDNSSVTNCYSKGDIVAYSNYQASGVSTDEYCYANAGGIVGFAEANTVIANCFSLGRTLSLAIEGGKYQKAGAIYGNTVPDGAGYADARKAVVVNCTKNGAAVDGDYIRNTLGWAEIPHWKFGDGIFPEIDGDAVISSFTVTVHLGGESTADKTSVVLDGYHSMAELYYANGENAAAGLPEYLAAASGKRTYGYFFDIEGRDRVPLSYVPTGNVTLYAKFSDYNNVKGTYYFATADGAYLTLSEDGSYSFANGALTEQGIYTYDGATGDIMLLDCCLAYLSGSTDFYYTSFKAVKAGSSLVISEPVFFPQGSELTASVRNADFVCGDYYDANGNEYLFFENGNGVRIVGQSSVRFTYTVTGGSAFTVRLASGTLLSGTLTEGAPALLNGLAVTAYDAFKGSWKKQMTTLEEITFDGRFRSDSEGERGSWTYTRYAVGTDGKRSVSDTKSGSYTVSQEGVLTASGGLSFTAEERDGLIRIALGGRVEIFGAGEGYIGVWRYANQKEPATLELKGLNRNGVGEATLVFNNSQSGPYALFYETVTVGGTPKVYLFRGAESFGELAFAESEFVSSTGSYKVRGTLEGQFYSESYGGIRTDRTAVFYLEDNFFGSWQGAEGDFFRTVVFDGKGYYDLGRGESHMAVSGTVNVTSKDSASYRAGYALVQGTEEGGFTLNYVETVSSDVYDPEAGEESTQQKTVKYSVEYTVSFNGEGNLVLTYVKGYGGSRTDLSGTHILTRPSA